MKNAIDTMKSHMTTKEIADMIRGMAASLGEQLDGMTDEQLVASTRRLVGAAEKERGRK